MSRALQKETTWFAVDWGTSNLRIWLMSKADKPLKLLTSGNGMANLEPQDFEPALLALIQPYLLDNTRMKVVCCGMVGSRQGWAEAKYFDTPCPPPSQQDATLVHTKDPRISVSILPGIKQNSPADVMRGEETQISGFLSQHQGYSGVICLPGTHTKWVRVAAGNIVEFSTFMTGELFSLLSKKSVLRHGVETTGWDQPAFDAAIADGMEAPERIAAKLFSIRAKHLIAKQTAEEGLSRLSGLLIGMELAATRAHWAGHDVTIIGAASIAGLYQSALAQVNAPPKVADVTRMTVLGLAKTSQTTKEPAQ